MNDRVRIWDFVLIAALTAVCFVLWFFPKEQGKTVTVTVKDKVVYQGSLKRDADLDLGDGMRVMVKNGAVWVEDSTCPDGLCEEMGQISSAGQVILCVPNRIAVEISGKEVDALVG